MRARLDFGRSIVFSRPVHELLAERALNTAVLAVAALVIATFVGIPLGVYTGSHRGGVLPALLRAASLVVLSVPPLLASLLLVWIAARTGWFPAGGMTSASAATASWSGWAADLAHHVPLPALALAMPLTATLERLQSQSIADAMHESFVSAARARGATWQRAVGRHAWPVSLGPVLGLYGVIIGSLFSGSFVVEVVTAWPGLGRLMYDALRGRDLYLVAGCAATGALFLALGTFASDVHADYGRSATPRWSARMTRRASLLLAMLAMVALVAPWCAPYDPVVAHRGFLFAPPMPPRVIGGGGSAGAVCLSSHPGGPLVANV